MTAPWLAALTVIAYFLAIVGVFRLINLGLSPWLETLLSVFAAPGVFAMLAWIPVLKRLGLSRGEMVVTPNTIAFVLLTGLYAALAFLLVTLVMRAWQR